MTQTKRRPTTRSERKAKNPTTLPARWTPRWLAGCDKRSAIVCEIRQRLQRLKEHAGIQNNAMKEMLAERAIFIACRLETMEVDAIETGEIEFNVYVAAVNGLSGLLMKLGLDKQAAKTAKSLDKHLKEKYGSGLDDEEDE